MPTSRNRVDPEAAWPDLCPTARRLRYACELAQDYVEKAKSKNYASAKEAKELAEVQLSWHLDQCSECRDHAAQTRSRLKARPRRAWRVRRARSEPSPERAVASALIVQYALDKFEGRLI